MTTSDIGEPARIAYAAGVDPIAWAEAEICALIGVHSELIKLNLDMGVDPGGDLSTGAMTRRILGLLLNSDWKAPEVGEMSDDSSETTSRADELDASLRFLLGGHVAVLTASELAALVQLRKTIGKVLDEAGQS